VPQGWHVGVVVSEGAWVGGWWWGGDCLGQSCPEGIQYVHSNNVLDDSHLVNMPGVLWGPWTS